MKSKRDVCSILVVENKLCLKEVHVSVDVWVYSLS